MEIITVPNKSEAEIKQMLFDSYLRAEKAICNHPQWYGKIKHRIGDVLSGTIEVGQYYRLACELAQWLEKMGSGNIFHDYYFENVHPDKQGRAKYFRAICYDLHTYLNDLNQWRKARHNLTLIK